MVESTIKELEQRFPHVDLWAKPQDTSLIIENIADFLDLSSDGCVENLIPEKSKFTEFACNVIDLLAEIETPEGAFAA